MSGILLDILVVLLAAKVAAEAAERLGGPAVVGEILAGVVVGPSVLGLVESGEVLRTLGELGVILLLLQVGMEMDLAELGGVGRASLLVALVGVAAPFAAGYGAMMSLGEDGHTALFVGAALTATSVGITARVFGDLRALSRIEARTVLGAAVADDVLGLVILTVVVRIVTAGSVSPAAVAGVVVVADPAGPPPPGAGAAAVTLPGDAGGGGAGLHPGRGRAGPRRPPGHHRGRLRGRPCSGEEPPGRAGSPRPHPSRSRLRPGVLPPDRDRRRRGRPGPAPRAAGRGRPPAGSGVVHAMGGVAGLAGALVLGARIGRYGPDGKPRTLLAHHIPMALLGTFILLFGWFGFNAASTFAVTDPGSPWWP